MEIYPAIDCLDQKVVRLYQGDYAQKEVYGTDPLAFAEQFQKAGATHLHLVDLDGAKYGKQRHFDWIRKLAEATDLFIEMGGGIRDAETIDQCLSVGIDRVILGTLAQKDPQTAQALLEKYGTKIAIGVDARDGKVAVNGWLETTETDAVSFCRKAVSWGARHIIFTEISRDGTGQGINLPLYQKLQEIPEILLTASGGITSMEDITQLKNSGIYGAILGKSLYSGKLALAEVIHAAGAQTKEGDA